MTFAITAVGVTTAATIGTQMYSQSQQKKAANQAGQQAQQAQNNALMQQQQAMTTNFNGNIPLIEDAYRNAMGYYSPYYNQGLQVNNALMQKMGITPDASGNYDNSLTRPFDAADYQKDVGYTPMSSNQFTREQYGQLPGVPALVSNTLTADEWKNDGTGTYTATPRTLEELQATPGYQFQLQQGLQEVNNSAAAKGSLMSGRTLKELNNYAQGQASTGFSDAWNRGQQAYQNAFARKQQQFQQGQQGYADEFGRRQLQFQQGQDALQNAYNRYGQNQNNTYNRLSPLASQGMQAAGALSNLSTQRMQDLWQNNQNFVSGMNNALGGYADNTGNIAYGRGTATGNANANAGIGIGNAINGLAGYFMTNNTGLGGSAGNNINNTGIGNAANSKSLW
jgi:hypothetical protein